MKLVALIPRFTLPAVVVVSFRRSAMNRCTALADTSDAATNLQPLMIRCTREIVDETCCPVFTRAVSAARQSSRCSSSGLLAADLAGLMIPHLASVSRIVAGITSTARASSGGSTSPAFADFREFSRFTVRAFATGMLAAMGHNPTIGVRDLKGEVSFNPEKAEASSFRLIVKTSSLSVQDDISDKDRREIERIMNQDVLQSAEFPEILYEAAGISISKMGDMLFSANLNGALTLHGFKRAQPIAARISLLGSMIRASGDFSLNQTDYNIKPVSVAGGAIKLKDEVKFSFEIVARRQE